MSALPKPAIEFYRCHCGAAGAFGYRNDGVMDWFCTEHRLRRWSADTCCSEVDRNAARDALLLADSAPPSLQMLVAEHGSCDQITVEAWTEHDAKIKMWQAQRREKYRRR